MSFFDFLTKKTPVKPKKEKTAKKAETPAEQQQPNPNVKLSGYGKQVTEFRPRSFDDVAGIIDCLIDNKPALVYLTEVRDTTSQRVLDILAGAIYAIDGSVSEVSEEVYIFTPSTQKG